MALNQVTILVRALNYTRDYARMISEKWAEAERVGNEVAANEFRAAYAEAAEEIQELEKMLAEAAAPIEAELLEEIEAVIKKHQLKR